MDIMESGHDNKPPLTPQRSDELEEAWLRDGWLDNALRDTFPASDPIASGRFD